jgi:hypothetical protein
VGHINFRVYAHNANCYSTIYAPEIKKTKTPLNNGPEVGLKVDTKKIM